MKNNSASSRAAAAGTRQCGRRWVVDTLLAPSPPASALGGGGHSHLRDHLARVAELVQHGALFDLLLRARAAQDLVHGRQAAHEEQRVLGGWEAVLLDCPGMWPKVREG